MIADVETAQQFLALAESEPEREPEDLFTSRSGLLSYIVQHKHVIVSFSPFLMLCISSLASLRSHRLFLASLSLRLSFEGNRRALVFFREFFLIFLFE
jgi:hypothetical protein